MTGSNLTAVLERRARASTSEPYRIRPRLSSCVRRSLAFAISAAMMAAFAGFSSSATASAAPTATSSATFTPKAVALDDAMRALWEAHGTWTERAIVDFVGNLPDTSVVITRLLENQVDIGNAVKPYYGNAAGNDLAALLRSHINDAVAVLEAAKSGDATSTSTAEAAFDANGVQIARFLHAANPRFWPLSAMEIMMSTHLSQVIGLATDQLTGKYSAAVSLYGVYIGHIIKMADMLSGGIEQQFPARFK